jgi:cephalosporin-C deacetylase
MKNPSCLLIPVLFAGILSSVSAAEPKGPFTVRADRENALYQTGETTTFTITTNSEAKIAPDAEVFWSMTKDGFGSPTKGSVKLEGGKATVTGKLDDPGFLLCRVSTETSGKGAAGSWGVGFSPEKIGRSMPIPEDFDAFWKGQLEKLATVPLNPVLTPVSNDKVKGLECFDTRVDCVGPKVSGYFARPSGAKPKSLPAIVTLHGAGIRSASLPGAMTWASQGFLAIDINAHGIDNGKDEAFYKALGEAELKDYRSIGKDSREKGYFVGMFLRAKRALDFLCAQPEWDGKNLIVSGGSQGGFQAFAAAALDERVTIMVAHVPAGCDHSGMLAGRISGWPKMVPVVDGKPDPAVLEASRYVDNVNFAARCKAETAVVSVGFVDGVCPPTSVYAAFNELPVKDKTIINVPGMGHSVNDKVGNEAKEIVKARLKK